MTNKNMEPFHNNPYDLLHQLGVSANYKGFFISAYAVTLCMQQKCLLLVTKWLCPEVARHYGTNWRAVERNTRTVSAIAWKRNRPLVETLAQRHFKRYLPSTKFLALLIHAVRPKDLMMEGRELS